MEVAPRRAAQLEQALRLKSPLAGADAEVKRHELQRDAADDDEALERDALPVAPQRYVMSVLARDWPARQ
jgi:hypothetical protein